MRLAARLALRNADRAAAEVARFRRACRSSQGPSLGGFVGNACQRKYGEAGMVRQRRIAWYVLRGPVEGKPKTIRARDAGIAGSLAVDLPLHFSSSCRGP